MIAEAFPGAEARSTELVEFPNYRAILTEVTQLDAGNSFTTTQFTVHGAKNLY